MLVSVLPENVGPSNNKKFVYDIKVWIRRTQVQCLVPGTLYSLSPQESGTQLQITHGETPVMYSGFRRNSLLPEERDRRPSDSRLSHRRGRFLTEPTCLSGPVPSVEDRSRRASVPILLCFPEVDPR